MKCLREKDYTDRMYCIHIMHTVRTKGFPYRVSREMWNRKHCYCKDGKSICKYLYILSDGDERPENLLYKQKIKDEVRGMR